MKLVGLKGWLILSPDCGTHLESVRIFNGITRDVVNNRFGVSAMGK